MNYTEYLPHPALRNYISAYWTISSDQAGEGKIHRILPDGCTDLIFNRGADLYGANHEKVMSTGQSYLVGMMTTYKDTLDTAGSSILGIRFKPGSMALFYRLDLQEITNLSVGCQDKKLADLICTGKDLLSNINQYFLEKLPAKPLALSAIITDLYANKGQVRVAELVSRYHMSERKMERLFKQDVGLSIKGLAKVIRFTSTLELIRKIDGRQSLTQIAFDAGYYDQAHLCNEIKAYTGLTPGQL